MLLLFATLYLAPLVLGQLVIYNSTTAIGADHTLSAGCASALKATIPCPQNLFGLAGQFAITPSDNSTVPAICGTPCLNGLSAFHKNVSTACTQNDKNILPGIPATYLGDIMWAYANRTCLKNSTTGKFCSDEIIAWQAQLPQSNYTDLTSIPKANLCSQCFLSFLSQAQSTSFSNYRADFIPTWQNVQKTCNVTYPTAAQPAAANMSLPQLGNYYNTSKLSAPSCLSKSTYTVKSGDTCNSIAKANSVSSGSLMLINNLFTDCSRMTVGASLCLPRKCNTYTVAQNDNCWTIATKYKLSAFQIQNWNPAVNQGCANLNVTSPICISPPGGTYSGTTIPGASPTQLSPYATTTIAPPGPTPYGTTKQCGRYYQVVSGDYCQKISLNQTISVGLFSAINPAINSGCSNLSPGLWYCVFPTQSWNATGSGCTVSPAVTAPAPTTSGTISKCYNWYVVKSGDYCALIQQQFNITMAQLTTWNPNLKSDCSNLTPQDAYCVDGVGNTCPSSSRAAANIAVRPTTSLNL